MAKKRKSENNDKNKPWISNYPPLAEWLEKHQARCMWQVPMNERPSDADYDWSPQAYIECYIIGRRLLIIVVRGNQNGWDIYTDYNSPRIDETLADAEKRCGVVPKE